MGNVQVNDCIVIHGDKCSEEIVSRLKEMQNANAGGVLHDVVRDGLGIRWQLVSSLAYGRK